MPTSAGLRAKLPVAAQSPKEKHHASGEERDAERVHHQFVDAEVHAFVKHRVRPARGPANRPDQCSMPISIVRDEQHHEAAEQQHVSDARQAAAPTRGVAAARRARAGGRRLANRSSVLLAVALPPQPHAADDAVNPSGHRQRRQHVEQHLRPARDVAEDLPRQLGGSRCRGHVSEQQPFDGFQLLDQLAARACTRRRRGRSRQRRKSARRDRC